MSAPHRPPSSPALGAGRFVLAGLLAVGVLIAGFGVWGTQAQISGAVIASGQVEVDRNRQVVQHPDGGVVSEIIAGEGDVVEAGALLLRLDASALRSDLAIVEAQLFELLARRGRLEAERDGAETPSFDPMLTAEGGPGAAELIAGQTRLFEARRDSSDTAAAQLSRQRAQIESQIAGLREQQAALADQAELLAQELADQRSLLDRGLTQASQVLTLQRQASEVAGRRAELTAQSAQAAERATEIDLQITGLTSTRREEAITQLRDLQYNQLELLERRQEMRRRLDRLDIRAPVAGVVYGMRVFAEQSVVSPADPLLYLIPQDRPLVIATQVQVTDIDQIHLGQEVSLRLAAFDQRRTPALTGRVTLVSADAFRDETTRQSYYRAEIELAQGEIERLPEGMVLLPGMPVEAFIRTADRSPLGYLVKPLADYFTRAFREA